MSPQTANERAAEMYRRVFPARPDDTIEGIRARFDAMLQGLPTNPTTVVSQIEVAGVPALGVTAAGARTDRALVWFHGGGYSIGTPAGYTALASPLSSACRMTVVVPDYRLAPEHPFPAAFDDAVAVLNSVVARYGERNTTVGGDSAGGALVFAALSAMRDAGSVRPHRAVAVSPLVDLSASGTSFDANADTDVALSRRAVAMVRATYLQGQDPMDGRASPVGGDLHDLPPSLVLVSSTEVLLDDARVLAGRLTESGGEATLVVADGMVHVWPLFSSFLPEGARAIAEIAEFIG